MIIDNDLVVKIGDGVAVFDEPTLRDWAILVDMEKKTVEQQADVLIPKLKEISGFQYRDGSSVTVEDMKNKKFSAKFFLQLVQGWTKAVVDSLQNESEAKNVETLN
jgi:TATA-binding protein-associated factor Taf7